MKIKREELRQILRGKCVTDEACETAIDEILNLHSVGRSERLPCEHEFTHKPLGGNVYCWKCCALQTK